MKAIGLFVCALCLVLPLSGCSEDDSPEGIAKSLAANMKQMAQILDGIRDEASAKDAEPRIREVRTTLKRVGERARKLKEDAASRQKLEAAVMKEMEGVWMAVDQARAKVNALMETDAKVRAVIEPALSGFEGDL